MNAPENHIMTVHDTRMLTGLIAMLNDIVEHSGDMPALIPVPEGGYTFLGHIKVQEMGGDTDEPFVAATFELAPLESV